MGNDQGAVKAGYKRTEVGVIPEDWEVRSIGDLSIKVGSGITPKGGSNVYGAEGIPFIRSQNVGWGNLNLDDIAFISEGIHKTFLGSEVREGDVLLNITGASIGRSSIANKYLDGSNVNQHVCIVRANKNKCIPNLIKYLFLSNKGQNQIESYQAGGNREGLNFAQIREMKFAISPDKTEQIAIAKSLSDTDALITSLNELIHKKEQIKQGTMQQLLTGKMRLQGFGEGKGVKQTELGAIPEDWGIMTIKELSLIPMQNGLFLDPSRRGTGIKIINVGDLYKTAPINIEELEPFNASAVEKKIYSVESGDLFFTRSSIVPSGIAFCNICELTEETSLVFDSHLIKVRLDTCVMYPRFAYLMLLSNIARKHLISNAKTATMTTIDQGGINSCPLLVPELEEQTAIANTLTAIDTDIQTLKQRLAKTKALKQGMMQELLTGKTRLLPENKAK